jgi:hypothetical protein
VGNKSGYTSAGKNAIEKANKFIDVVEQHGWESKVSHDAESQVTHLFARRGENETINIWWHGPKAAIIKGATPTYQLAGEVIKLNNVSAAVSLAIKPADTSRLGKAVKRRARRVNNRNSALSTEALSMALTGDDGADPTATLTATISAATATLGSILGGSDADVKAALAGKVIQWVNGQSGQLHEGHVGKIKKIVRNGHDFVEFTDREGFHAVYLDRIVSIA